MLPGFRFLFTAIVLTMSILVFGLGAAALLRAAHEEFVTLPTRRAPPERMFARQTDIPTLALLRVEPDTEKAPAVAPPIFPDASPVAERADANTAEPEKTAALKPEEPQPLGDAARVERPAVEAVAEAPAAPTSTEAVPAAPDVKIAALAEAAPADTATAASPIATEEASAAPANTTLTPEGALAATRIATLGGPPVVIEDTSSAKTTDARPDRSAVRKRAAQRAREKRRIARRARLAREAALAAQQQQQQVSPFEQAPVARRAR